MNIQKTQYRFLQDDSSEFWCYKVTKVGKINFSFRFEDFISFHNYSTYNFLFRQVQQILQIVNRFLKPCLDFSLVLRVSISNNPTVFKMHNSLTIVGVRTMHPLSDQVLYLQCQGACVRVTTLNCYSQLVLRYRTVIHLMY